MSPMPVILDEPPGAAEPLSLPQVSEGDVQRCNALFGIARDIAFTWAGKPASVRFFEPAEAIEPAGWLHVRLGDHGFELGLLALPEPATLGAAFAGIEVRQLPEELLLGVLETWLDEPIAALQRAGVSFQLSAWQSAAKPGPVRCAWELTWAGQERFLRGTLHADTEAVTHLVNLAQRARPIAARSADATPFSVSVSLGHVSLPVATSATLLVGDVVWLPVASADLSQGHCELWTAGRVLGRARRQQNTVTLLTMNAPAPAQPAPGAPSASRIDDLPVSLVFDVGQIELNVGQLRTLNPGYTFELPGMPDRLVTIRANGREIGQGELVEVGDKVGVRIVNWSLA